MSISALMFMTVAGGIVKHSMMLDEGSELKEILATLKDLISLTRGGVSECVISWSVPSTLDGSEIWLDICHKYMIASVDSRTAGTELSDPVHIWEWQGEPLNQSFVETSDNGFDHLKVRTGDALLLRSCLVLMDEETVLLSFIAKVT